MASSTEESLHHRLQVALDANAAAYRRAVQTSTPGECWDVLVLTAANEKQARGYRLELALRQRAVGPAGAFFPGIQKCIVVADPPGRRAGSGGATLGVMQAMGDELHLQASDLERLRILVIHSGGASQRLPAYSPTGKIFSPLPLVRPDGQISTLFDHLYLTLAGLPERLGAGMLVVAGDVFLLFDHRQVSAPAGGVAALSMSVPAELGRGHGVFVADEAGKIARVLQKASSEELEEAGAVDGLGRVLIDTGLLFFDPQQTRRLAELAGCKLHWPQGDGAERRRGRSPGRRIGLHESYGGQIDLYEDITAALAAETDRERYLGGRQTGEMRRQIWKSLHGAAFQVVRLDGEFLHLGTTRQFRDAMVLHDAAPAARLFQHNILAHGAGHVGQDRRVFHSALLSEDVSIGAGSVIEHSILGAGARVGEGCVVSQACCVKRPLRLPDNLLFFQVPIQSGDGTRLYAQVLCGVEDDFKGKYPDGPCLFLNAPIEQWMERHRISAREIWPNVKADQRTLWTARLFVGTPERDAADVAMWFASKGSGVDCRNGPKGASHNRLPTPSALQRWRKSPRFSMAMLLEQSDSQALIEHRETVAACLHTHAAMECVRRDEDRPLDLMIGHYATAAAYRASIEQIEDEAGRKPREPQGAMRQARMLWCAAQLAQRADYPEPTGSRPVADEYMKRAFAKIAEASELASEASEVGRGRLSGTTGGLAASVLARQTHTGSKPPVAHGQQLSGSESDSKARLKPGQRIEAASPVRLDLAGGWSDTPPYCYEQGGHVVNVAIDLDAQPPVRAMVRVIHEPILILESNDLAQHLEVRDGRQLSGPPDVRDPFALHKVAAQLVGLMPRNGTSLSHYLRRLGGGLIISTECRVPKGSGLGTSSILAATLLGALHEALGQPASREQLMKETLLLEQRLGTGGGWQDQVGGIFGGVKSTTTTPGLPQSLTVEQLALSDEQLQALDDRLVVYYSGHQRLARDILRRVMGRWLGREPVMMGLMAELKTSAAALRDALLRGRWPVAATQIARYWELKRMLYPGSTTPAIDVLFLDLKDHYLAAGLAGAGGGGFSYFFCRDAKQAGRLKGLLASRAGRFGVPGGLYRASINRTGLRITGA